MGQICTRDRSKASLAATYFAKAEVAVLREPSPYQIHAGHMVAVDTDQWSLGSAVELWRFDRVRQG